MDTLIDRKGVQPMLPIEVFVTIDAMLNFNGDHDGHGSSDVTCKQTLTQLLDEIRKANM